MERQILSYLTMVFIATSVALTSCDNDESGSTIQVQDKDALNQTMFADQTSGQSGITFVTDGAWTSTIEELAGKSAKAGTSSWVSITPDHGDSAGTYTIGITLQPNTTGADRTAVITIKGKDSNVTITVEQKGVKESESNNPTGEKWIDANGNTSEPKNSRDVRNNTNGFDTSNYTPISYEGEVTLYAQNYAYGKDDNYDIKLYIKNGNDYTQIGKLYGYGDNLKVEVFKGHTIRLVWQRHQLENKYYVVDLTGSFSTTYKKDFKGENTGYTSGNIYVKYK
jgi:hypothetical protein